LNSSIFIKNGLLWPSPEAIPIPGGGIRVQDGRISAIGAIAEEETDEIIDARGRLVMPGLIQVHVHLCQTLFRGVAEDLPLLPWLKRFIWPLEAGHDEASIRASAALSVAEFFKSGTTAFQSMETVRHTDAVFDVVSDTGAMGIISHCLMDETSGYEPLSVSLDDSLRFCDRLLDTWKDHDLLRLGIAPRFALSCSAQNMKAASDYARANGLVLHTHASEQLEEVELVFQQTGLANIEYLETVGLTGPDVGLAHCVHTRSREREILQQTDTKILHCPSANLKLGSGVAPIPEYLELGLTVGIGADGAPCNNRLDALMEMREAGLIQKPRLGPEALPARDIVRMSTELGAKAMGWADEMGTLEVGKRANLIIVDQDTLHAVPSDDPATNLVYSNTAADVQLTMINGRVVYRDGELTTIDEEKLRYDARQQMQALIQRADLPQHGYVTRVAKTQPEPQSSVARVSDPCSEDSTGTTARRDKGVGRMQGGESE
jgi:5-methylthioadenosine/S-adenosylhomocysteine deaminase